jgi:hypothetical protein
MLTTKFTKDTKVSEILFLNFVLFVSFVVRTVVAYLLAALPRWVSVVNTLS